LTICDVQLTSEVCGGVGDGTASLITKLFDWLANAIGSVAAWMFETVWSPIDTTTLVDLADPAYLGASDALFGVAGLLTR
jgi:type IV secretion system protein TrbL